MSFEEAVKHSPDRRQSFTRRDLRRVAVGCMLACFCAPASAKSTVGKTLDGCVDVDLSRVAAGESLTVFIARKRVVFRHRTEQEIAAARSVALDDLEAPQSDEERVQRPEWLIVEGTCTHMGCPLLEGLGKYGGWLCPCHGSAFDASGRVRSGPALENLPVPRYEFISSRTVRIGCIA